MEAPVGEGSEHRLVARPQHHYDDHSVLDSPIAVPVGARQAARLTVAEYAGEATDVRHMLDALGLLDDVTVPEQGEVE